MAKSPMCSSLLILLLGLLSQAQQQPVLTSDQVAQAAQADVEFQKHNVLAALPIYEQLAKEVPQSPLFAERLAECLLGSIVGMPEGPDRKAILDRVKNAAQRAQFLGDRSDLLNTILERLSKPLAPEPVETPNSARMKEAEVAFSKGDLDTALNDYKSIAAADPRSYEATLFAGDIYFRKHDADQAGQWFQRAIVIDPNREIAYRYWGDTLKAAGANDEAREKYIDAIVASPYERLAWVGLSAWAKQAHATLAAPQVPKLQEPVYQETRAAWHNELFAKKYPAEKEYRHTLAEETDALRAVLKAISDSKISEDQLDPGLRNLSILNRDEMLEAFVLINAADNGIGKDYPAYRETHRDQLHAYIAKYLIHPAPAP